MGNLPNNQFQMISGLIILLFGIIFLLFNDHISKLLAVFGDYLNRKKAFKIVSPIYPTNRHIKFIGFMWILISIMFFCMAYLR
jgi:hypothetical protein